jgi:hypothetical protein
MLLENVNIKKELQQKDFRILLRLPKPILATAG